MSEERAVFYRGCFSARRTFLAAMTVFCRKLGYTGDNPEYAEASVVIFDPTGH